MPLVEVKVLGPLEVRVDGRAVELRRKKQRALLALLALRAGEVVSTDRLVDDLWGESPPKAAVGSLQNLVSELRKLIGPELLVTRAPGYVLELEPQAVDAHRFERAVREGDALREALALWRGPALADLAYEPFAQAEIARFEELRATAREQLFDAELAQGRHTQLVAELEAFVVEHPLRERPRGQLMVALYRSGRQADALEAYRQARETLVEELGIDPSAELQQLEQAILRHDPAVGFEEAETAPAVPDRRGTVTVLFADVVDSTDLGAQLDPEVVRSVMTRYSDAVRTVVERHGGVVEKFIGDAAMAVFGVPTLHEDDALRAVRAACELRDDMASLNAELGEDYGVALQLRMGLNSGEVLVSESAARKPLATGKAVNVAMRLEQAAPPDKILLGEATYMLVRHAVDADPLEPLDLGGALGRIAAFQLVKVGEAVRPLSTAALVGRRDEVAWLQAAFAGVCAERRSKVVTVLGEAGVGKTRLVSEVISGIGEEAAALVGRCVSYGEGATFLPLAEIVQQAVPVRPRRTIAALLPDDEHASLIAEHVTQLTGRATGVASTGEVFWAVRRLLEALALRRPHVVVMEDVHWAEPTLLDLIEYLRAWTTDSPLLVVCLARPELLEQRPGWAAQQTLRLEPLDADDAEALVAELGGEELAEDARLRIVEVSEGNPLFLEQLLAFAQEVGPKALSSVPPTVEALLAGRIDRLEPEDRGLLERAAVAGRDFVRNAVVHLSPPDELASFDSRLATLVRRGLVDPDGDAFRFHHALIRDVAYAGVTKTARAELHERFGTWLELREEGAEEIVGYHLEQAHRYRVELQPSDPELPALARRAGAKLADAGTRAFKRADTPATVNLLGRSVVLLSGGGPERIEVMCELGIAQQAAGDLEASESVLIEAVERAKSAGERRLELVARIELLYLRLFTDREADPKELLDLAEEASETFERVGDDRALGRTWRHVGFIRGSMEGRCADWLEAAESALRHYRRSGWSASGCLGDLTAALFYGPTPVPEGIERCQQLLNETTDRFGRANVLAHLGGLHALANRFEDAFSFVAEADLIYQDLGEAYTRANIGGRVRGRVHRLADEPQAAERVFRECCGTFERARDAADFATIAAELGQALYSQDRYVEAAEWGGLAKAHAPGGDITAQFSWRALQGKLLGREGRLDEAEALMLEALDLVGRTDLLTHRGEVLLDSAHVQHTAGRGPEAALTVRRALEFFERKGNAASADNARSSFSDLVVA